MREALVRGDEDEALDRARELTGAPNQEFDVSEDLKSATLLLTALRELSLTHER